MRVEITLIPNPRGIVKAHASWSNGVLVIKNMFVEHTANLFRVTHNHVKVPESIEYEILQEYQNALIL